MEPTEEQKKLAKKVYTALRGCRHTVQEGKLVSEKCIKGEIHLYQCKADHCGIWTIRDWSVYGAHDYKLFDVWTELPGVSYYDGPI